VVPNPAIQSRDSLCNWNLITYGTPTAGQCPSDHVSYFALPTKSERKAHARTAKMSPSATEPPTSRDALTSRVLPQMTLSTGDEASLTGPPAPMPHYLNAEGRARLRFEVEGNAM